MWGCVFKTGREENLRLSMERQVESGKEAFSLVCWFGLYQIHPCFINRSFTFGLPCRQSQMATVSLSLLVKGHMDVTEAERSG